MLAQAFWPTALEIFELEHFDL